MGKKVTLLYLQWCKGLSIFSNFYELNLGRAPLTQFKRETSKLSLIIH